VIGGGGSSADFVRLYLEETQRAVLALDPAAIDALAVGLAAARDNGGRLFILGVGGSAGHASHAVNDFRKICGFEAYAPTDNVSELTARVNDEGWDTCFSEWLKVSRLGARDAILVLSVGGGNREKNISMNLVRALELAKDVGSKIFGVVGEDGGTTKATADACVVIPTVSLDRITRTPRGWRRWSGICWSATPRSNAPRRSGNRSSDGTGALRRRPPNGVALHAHGRGSFHPGWHSERLKSAPPDRSVPCLALGPGTNGQRRS
jgi:D-sedoheptulose 7-phosphate isomerase